MATHEVRIDRSQDAARGAGDRAQPVASGHPADGALRARRRGGAGDPGRVRRADGPGRHPGDRGRAQPGRRAPADRPGVRRGRRARRPARGGDPRGRARTATATPCRCRGSASCATCSPSRSWSAGTSPTAGRPPPTCPGCASPARRSWAPSACPPGTRRSAGPRPASRRLLDRGGFVAAAVGRRPPCRPTRAIAGGGAAHDPAAGAGRQRRHQAARRRAPGCSSRWTPPARLFSAGDAHFAQGDCETCGTAIEMRATLRVRFAVHKGEAAEQGASATRGSPATTTTCRRSSPRRAGSTPPPASR